MQQLFKYKNYKRVFIYKNKMDWKLKTIRDCFKLFIEQMKKDDIEHYDIIMNSIKDMEIDEIKYYVDVMYMKYIVKHVIIVPNSTITTYVYKLMDNQIKEYNRDNIQKN